MPEAIKHLLMEWHFKTTVKRAEIKGMRQLCLVVSTMPDATKLRHPHKLLF